jgi:hypothetical protein
MDWAVYGALIAAFVVTVAAAAVLAVRILDGWRTLKRFRRHLGRSLADLADSADRTSLSAERVSDQRELEESLARLERSLRRFNVLRAAVDEVSQSFLRVSSVYPRK